MTSVNRETQHAAERRADLPPELAVEVHDPSRAAAWQERFRAILEVARLISSTLDLDELLRLVMDRVTSAMEADRSTLFLVDDEKGEIWSKIAQGTQLREIRLPIGKGIAGWVAQSGRALNIRDAYLDPRFNDAIDKQTGYRTRSVLCVPMRGKGGHLLGLIQTLNKRSGVFSVEDEWALTALASQAGIALENANLYQTVVGKNAELIQAQLALQQKIAELDLLFDVEREISAAADLQAMIQAIVAKAMGATGAEAGAILLREPETGDLTFRGALGGAGDQVKLYRVKLGEGIAGTVAKTGQPLITNEPHKERVYDGALSRKVGYAVRSVVCVPILLEGEMLGVLEVLNKLLPGGFTDDDLKLLTMISGQAARAIVLAREREQTERGARLASIGQMLSSVLHDIKTPMTIISGYSQLMAEEESADTRRAQVDLILKQFEHISSMTREVLAFVRGERELLVRKVHLNAFLAEVEEFLTRDLADKNVQLRVRASYKGVARFDESKMKRVIYNLARNAVQAMTGGGKFSIGVARAGDQVVFRFSDTGPGISEEIAPRLFQSFATHGKKDGTGLGLAIVKQIVEAHGGKIDFKSVQGKGTTFIVRLPGAG